MRTNTANNESVLEMEADLLLAMVDQDPEYPAYPERNLKRHLACDDISLDELRELEEDPEDPAAGVLAELLDDVLDDLGLSSSEITVMRLYLQGWTQDEIAEALDISQQRVAVRIRRCLGVAASPRGRYAGWYQVYLEEIRRTIYRKPSRQKRRRISPDYSYTEECLGSRQSDATISE